MDFSISEEQRKLLDELDEFCDENLREPDIQQWLSEGGVPGSLVMGYYDRFGHIGIRADYDGKLNSVLSRVLVLEHLGLRAGATLPFQSMMFDTYIVSKLGDEQQIELLRETLKRTKRPPISFAITEPTSGSDSLNANTTAVEDEDGFVINGIKSFVSAGQYSPYVGVLAHDVSLESDNDGRKPLTMFLVERSNEGLDAIAVPKVGQNLIPTAEIILEDVRVPKGAVLGTRGQAAEVLLNSYEHGRLYVCATTVGMAQAAFKQAVSHAVGKTVSGKPVLSFQLIQDMIVDMQTKIDSMRALLYKTACGLDGGSEHSRMETALLKRFVPKTAMEVADSAMQIMGSVGYMSTTKASRIWQECRGNRFAEGTDQVMTVVAAKRIARREISSEESASSSWSF